MNEITLENLFGKRAVKSVISILREKYPGKWVYRTNGVWEHVGKGYAKYVSHLGGFTGDKYCGSSLYYYPKKGTPEFIM